MEIISIAVLNMTGRIFSEERGKKGSRQTMNYLFASKKNDDSGTLFSDQLCGLECVYDERHSSLLLLDGGLEGIGINKYNKWKSTKVLFLENNLFQSFDKTIINECKNNLIWLSRRAKCDNSIFIKIWH